MGAAWNCFKPWTSRPFGKSSKRVVTKGTKESIVQEKFLADTIKAEQQTSGCQIPFNATEVDDYVLKRNWQGSSRLNLQFFLWKTLLGFNLHPDIPQPGPTARIADVATGTGIWLVDVASTLPSTVTFDGFDVSLDQTPEGAFLPSNISIHQWDIFQEPPSKFVGQFDIVHIRLVTLVIKDNNPEPLIRNLRKLLKPGGYLQWDEVDATGSYIHAAVPDMPTPALENLFKTFKIPKLARGRDDWKALLPDTLNRHGFEGTKLHSFETSPVMARFWHDMYMQSWEEFAARIFGGTELANTALAAAEIEAHKGAVVIFPACVWVSKAI